MKPRSGTYTSVLLVRRSHLACVVFVRRRLHYWKVSALVCVRVSRVCLTCVWSVILSLNARVTLNAIVFMFNFLTTFGCGGNRLHNTHVSKQ